MGYSTPKEPFDLKAFLSEPAKKRSSGGFGFRRSRGPVPPTPVAQAAPEAAATAAPHPLEKPDDSE